MFHVTIVDLKQWLSPDVFELYTQVVTKGNHVIGH